MWAVVIGRSTQKWSDRDLASGSLVCGHHNSLSLALSLSLSLSRALRDTTSSWGTQPLRLLRQLSTLPLTPPLLPPSSSRSRTALPCSDMSEEFILFLCLSLSPLSLSLSLSFSLLVIFPPSPPLSSSPACLPSASALALRGSFPGFTHGTSGMFAPLRRGKRNLTDLSHRGYSK